MLKLFKRIISVSLVICLFLTNFCFAKSNEVTLQSVSEQYSLKDIDSRNIPDGIKPIEFNSVAELNKYLSEKQIQNKVDKANFDLAVKKINNERSIKISSGNTLAATSTSNYILKGSLTKTASSFTFGSYMMNVKFQYNNECSPKRFTSWNSTITYISGVAPGIEYTQDYSDGYVTDSGRTLVGIAEGIEKDYLLVEGGIKLYEFRRSFSVSFGYTLL